MDALIFPNWVAMAELPPARHDGCLAELRLARAALARGAMFLAREYGLLDEAGNVVRPATDPQAGRIIEEMAGAHLRAGEAIFRLTGGDV